MSMGICLMTFTERPPKGWIERCLAWRDASLLIEDTRKNAVLTGDRVYREFDSGEVEISCFTRVSDDISRGFKLNG